jgi:hypothetical protein
VIREPVDKPVDSLSIIGGRSVDDERFIPRVADDTCEPVHRWG